MLFYGCLEGKGKGMALCKFCDITDWQNDEFTRLAADIMGGEAVQHRKLWEFTQTVLALRQFGLLDDRSHVLSIAAGTERVLYYLANHVRRIIATDIYGMSSFSYREATTTFLSHPEAFAPYEYRKNHLVPISMDALALRFPEDSIDAVFSLSSIEHFGGVRAAERAVQEIRRVLKPGGIAVVVTDCSLNDRGTDQVFTRKEIEQLAASSGLSLVEPIDWQVSRKGLEHVADMKRSDLTALPHINLQIFSSIFTSICLVLRKDGEHRFSDPAQFDSVLEEVRFLPFVRSPFSVSPWEKVRAKSRCLTRRVERKIEQLRGVSPIERIAARGTSRP